MKILVVDDNSDFRNSLVEYLKSKSYLAEGVSNGKLALQKLDNNKFDLVLLDLIMSGMDGFETMKKIEKQLAKKLNNYRINFPQSLILTGCSVNVIY